MSDSEISISGGFPVSTGIDNVVAALEAGFPAARIRIHDLPELGPTLHFITEQAFFATLFMEELDVFFFDGSVQGSLDDAIAFVRGMSECLAASRLEHDFHVQHGSTDDVTTFEYPGGKE